MQKIVACALHKFGDNIGVAGGLSQLRDVDIHVCVKKLYEDAFYNVPNISKIINCESSQQAHIYASENNMRFIELTNQFLGHTRFDKLHYTPVDALRGQGFDYVVPKCGFWPTEQELSKSDSYSFDKPLLGIEATHTSDQSFLRPEDFSPLIRKMSSTHRILWLSHNNHPPEHIIQKYNIDLLTGWTRREVCCLFPKIDLFVSVMSGLYWASKCFERVPNTVAVCTENWQKWAEDTNTKFFNDKVSFLNWCL